jgi:hypothetical protein
LLGAALVSADPFVVARVDGPAWSGAAVILIAVQLLILSSPIAVNEVVHHMIQFARARHRHAQDKR